MFKPNKHARPDRAEAFLPDPEDEPDLALRVDDDVEAFGEEFVASATGGGYVLEDARNEETDDEIDSARAGAWYIEPEGLDDERLAADA